MLPTHNRYDYSPIIRRANYSWPHEKRLAFYIVTNLEVFAFGAGLGNDFCNIGAPQTQRNYAWRDYGNRVGIWRLFDIFDSLGVPAAHNVNSLLYDYHPQIFVRIRARGDEIVAHGRTNAERLDAYWELDEQRFINEVTEIITHHEKSAPRGWMGPGLAHSNHTLDFLKQSGYLYQMDWPCDDQPIWMRTSHGPILSLPYSVEINDSFTLVQRQRAAREFADMIVDQFEQLLEESEAYPLVCAISLHPFVVGQAFRLTSFEKALRHCVSHSMRDKVWFTTPGEVAQHCLGLPAGVVPGSEEFEMRPC